MDAVDVWLVVGTRRWARLIVSELCAALPVDAVVHMQGDPADAELQAWLSTTGLATRVEVGLGLPPCPASATGVAFVVNSAYLHKTSVEDMLEAGYNIVCEKPMSFSRQETLSLINMAASSELRLFSTNTYLFASYLDRFKQDWLAGHRFDSMYISWADPVNEVRYGETKGYDSSLPLIYDVLPHIANIAQATLGEFTAVLRSIEVRRGGSEVSIHYQHGDFDIHVALERNAKQRKRTLTFTGVDHSILLDFSSEPGSVSVDQLTPVSVDPDWRSKPKPIAAMIRSVSEYFESGKKDSRLCPHASLIGNDLIESVACSYVDQQVSLLSDFGHRLSAIDSLADLDYAGKEARSVATRALPYLSEESPLRKLASAAKLSLYPN